MERKKQFFKVLIVAALGIFSQVTAHAVQSRQWAQDFSLSQSSSARLNAVKSVFQGPNLKAQPALISAFSQEPRASIRAWMVRAEHHVSPKNLSFFETALKDSNVQVREAAIVALGESQNPQAAKDLSALLSTESDSGARMTIAFWLGFLGGPEAVTALSQDLTHDQDPNVRLQVAQSLKKIGGGSALSALSQAAKDPSARVRGLAQ